MKPIIIFLLFLFLLSSSDVFSQSKEKHRFNATSIIDSTHIKIPKSQIISNIREAIKSITKEDAVMDANFRIAVLRGRLEALEFIKEDSVTVPKELK